MDSVFDDVSAAALRCWKGDHWHRLLVLWGLQCKQRLTDNRNPQCDVGRHLLALFGFNAQTVIYLKRV